MEDIETITDDLINELLQKKLKSSTKNYGVAMDIINQNIKRWDKKLKVACADAEVDYLDMILHILSLKGYVLDRTTLTTYIHRARKPLARKSKKVKS